MAEPERSWDDHEVVELQEDYEDEIAGLRARLTTFEQERKAADEWAKVMEHERDYEQQVVTVDLRERLAAAEARVEAAEQALPDGALVMRCAAGVASQQEGHELIAAFQAARAALACPPQQRGE